MRAVIANEMKDIVCGSAGVVDRYNFEVGLEKGYAENTSA